MEAAEAAAWAAAAAAKDAAAAAATKAAAAAATAKEKKAAAKKAALVASAAELNAKQAAARASAAELDAKEATATAVQASRKRKFHLVDGQARSDGDFISCLPDDLLDRILLLLSTKERARTQAISRRWRPLWRSTPLTLARDFEVKSNLITKVLAGHPGPGRCFSLILGIGDCCDKIQGWLSSQSLDNLQELELAYHHMFENTGENLYLLPSLVYYRFAPTLCVAKFSGFHLPDLTVQLSLKLPCLKQLTLDGVIISEGTLQSIFSGCSALESLEAFALPGGGEVFLYKSGSSRMPRPLRDSSNLIQNLALRPYG